MSRASYLDNLRDHAQVNRPRDNVPTESLRGDHRYYDLDVDIVVTPGNPVIDLHRGVLDQVTRIELLQWKSTGNTDNPSNVTGLYADDVYFLQIDKVAGSGGGITHRPNATGARTNQLMLDIQKPRHGVTLGDTHHYELGQELAYPRIVFNDPEKIGDQWDKMEIRLLKEDHVTPAIFEKLYLFLRFRVRNLERRTSHLTTI